MRVNPDELSEKDRRKFLKAQSRREEAIQKGQALCTAIREGAWERTLMRELRLVCGRVYG